MLWSEWHMGALTSELQTHVHVGSRRQCSASSCNPCFCFLACEPCAPVPLASLVLAADAPPPIQERALAKSLMELPDGRPSALAASIAAEGAPAVADEGAAAKTFDVGSTKGAAGRLMTAEERKALEEAIERSSSLEEIRNLEERLKLGYTVAAKKDEEMQS